MIHAKSDYSLRVTVQDGVCKKTVELNLKLLVYIDL